MKKLKRKNKKTSRSLLKILAVLLLTALNWQAILSIGESFAYYTDIEISSGNIYSASVLDFSLRSGQADFIPPAQNMIPGTSTARDIYITKLGELDFKYRAYSEPVGGLCNSDLYNTLQLKVWYNWYDATGTKHMDLKYDGLLKDFYINQNDPDLQIYNSHPYYPNPFYAENEHWLYFQITLPEDIGNLQNKTCQFKFVFDGWQTDFNSLLPGFSDTEEILNTISTGDWMPKVTVIYPNGGEIWYMVPDNCPDIPACSAWCQQHGMNENCQYPIEWTAINKIGPDMDLWIDIYYSVDSGQTWMAQIADNTENDGIFWWKIPYDPSYISDHARIKVEAIHKEYSFLTDWDMSDDDFCPPMLSINEILNWGQPEPTSTQDFDRDEEIEIILPPFVNDTLSDRDTEDNNGASRTNNSTSSEELPSNPVEPQADQNPTTTDQNLDIPSVDENAETTDDNVPATSQDVPEETADNEQDSDVSPEINPDQQENGSAAQEQDTTEGNQQEGQQTDQNQDELSDIPDGSNTIVSEESEEETNQSEDESNSSSTDEGSSSENQQDNPNGGQEASDNNQEEANLD